MGHFQGFLVVFFGGGLGSILRHTVNRLCAAAFGVELAWGTLVVNVFGSLVMGLVAGWLALRGEHGQWLRLFFATGILGGFTTFSAFSLDTVLLWERGHVMAAMMYVAASVGASVIGVVAGLFAVRWWLI